MNHNEREVLKAAARERSWSLLALRPQTGSRYDTEFGAAAHTALTNCYEDLWLRLGEQMDMRLSS